MPTCTRRTARTALGCAGDQSELLLVRDDRAYTDGSETRAVQKISSFAPPRWVGSGSVMVVVVQCFLDCWGKKDKSSIISSYYIHVLLPTRWYVRSSSRSKGRC